jgi:hypothetical protein
MQALSLTKARACSEQSLSSTVTIGKAYTEPFQAEENNSLPRRDDSINSHVLYFSALPNYS